jgi:dTDP-4-amino-4,6-dideoxygalactose transaminase
LAGPGAQLIGQEEIDEVLDVLRGGHLSRYGSEADTGFRAKVATFESEAARIVGLPYCLAVNSGTSALWIALTGLGVGPGDEVIVPGYTFVASISSIAFARAYPVLAEIDESFNLDPSDVEAKITTRTKAIMAVHMLGSPAQMDEIASIAKRKGLLLIEDCAQAFGATYRGCPVGSIGDAGAYSFNVFKTITAGEGGMVATRDESAYRRFFALHDQGHTPLRRGVEVGARPFFGLDFRMTELTGAVLLAQVRKLAVIRERLHANKQLFKRLIEDVPDVRFRSLPDPAGELATWLVVTLPTEQAARAVAHRVGTSVLADSGWHVYSNMEQLLDRSMPVTDGCPFKCPCHGDAAPEYRKGMLPRTDDLLSRAIPITIGGVDAGSFGVGINHDASAVEQAAERFRRAVVEET